jgi:hypothetical protein
MTGTTRRRSGRRPKCEPLDARSAVPRQERVRTEGFGGGATERRTPGGGDTPATLLEECREVGLAVIGPLMSGCQPDLLMRTLGILGEA